MTTRVLTFSGDVLRLNVSTGASGRVRVEVQDTQGRPLPGYGLEDCHPLVGDSIEMPVRWKAREDVHALQGQPVKLLIEMHDADLYSWGTVPANQLKKR